MAGNKDPAAVDGIGDEIMIRPSKTLRAPNQLDALAVRDRALMIRCRCIGIVWAQNHGGIVNAAIVRRIEPAYREIHRKKQGHIFVMPSIFEMVSRTKSSAKSRKGGTIGVWRIKDNVAANEYLKEANMELPNIQLI